MSNNKSNLLNSKNSSAHENASYHIPVLFHECMEALNIQPSGIYVDCTFGGGGHSRGILSRLNDMGRLIAFDQDADAISNLPQDSRVTFIPQNFRYLSKFLRLNGIDKVDGILADLGVSSHQFDEGERGFSIRFDGPLDMRMDQRSQLTAQSIIADYTEAELHKIFELYGEVTNAKTLAKHIVQNRSHQPFGTINQFIALLHAVVKGNPKKYLAQVFQALRIVVNDEMQALKDLLQQTPSVLKPGGRLAVITFHSLEDKWVKQFMKEGTFDQFDDHPFLNKPKSNVFKIITKKPVTAKAEELKQNNRARSAKLRVAEKL